MANALTNLNKEVWASSIQKNLHNKLVAMDITNMELRAQLSDGDTAN